MFAVPEEFRMYIRLSSAVYANPQLHLNRIFGAFSEKRTKPKEKKKTTSAEKQHLTWNKSM